MTFWDKVRKAFGREAAEAEDVAADATARGNAALDARERELNATPAEKMQIEQDKIAASDVDFDALREKIEHTAAMPEGTKEAEAASAVPGPTPPSAPEPPSAGK